MSKKGLFDTCSNSSIKASGAVCHYVVTCSSSSRDLLVWQHVML